MRPRRLHQAIRPGRRLPELEQQQPDPKGTARLLQQAHPHQLMHRPVHRGLGQPGPPGQLRDAERAVPFPELLQQNGRTPDRADLTIVPMSGTHPCMVRITEGDEVSPAREQTPAS
ncbi:hypothetical protein GCM10009555_095830 [Acrocarpospora macrocephala]|uniref:Uncharacterized protein n=1 Tax=Acrocarpospora macrocephala TaxID=150177 RepID=A0A5M3WN17_9ACTN|nr:hypothetical protein Amac_030680 [Acrocarpospora macrocephala]